MAPGSPDTGGGRGDSRSATFAEKQPRGSLPAEGDASYGTPSEEAAALAEQWRMLARLATGVAVLTAPFFFLLLYRVAGWGPAASAILTALCVFAFRGLFDVVSRRFIPFPGVFHSDRTIRAEDITARRRRWFWRFWYRLAMWLAILWLAVALVVYVADAIKGEASVVDALASPWNGIADQLDQGGGQTAIIGFAITIALLFLVNTLIFLGPMMYAGIRQIKYFEPGDADWGVLFDDVRGQSKPKDEVRKIVSLWQSGREFEQAGGKRERGVLFFGAPGTGKTMLAKAIATGFNCPFVSVPGSGITQSFVGVDVLLVNWMTWRARRLARKWGGQCIVFIDEIDAIGSRRTRLLDARKGPSTRTIHDVGFFGPMGAINPSGDLIKESDAWRERLFRERAPQLGTLYPTPIQRLADRVREFAMPGLAGSGQGGLQQLLIAMDGVTTPRATRRWLVNRVNTVLDATYVIPARLGNVPLRLPAAKPSTDEQLYFIGACNVGLDDLDPALVRPGRMGRHVFFRTPDAGGRKDIIDLYLGKVAHDAELDSEQRRKELARITMGHSPAMIEQVCSLALTYAHHDGRHECRWRDLLEAVTVVEYGLESGFKFIPTEERAIAVHEAGHAVTGHVYMKGHLSTRLTITPRGDSAGHHSMREIDERFAWWQHEQFAELVWTLGAMAAERVFYGENGQGVGGDVASATADAALMVGVWGMSPRWPDLRSSVGIDGAEIAERKLMRRYEHVGTRIMNRASYASALDSDPIAAVLADPAKKTMVAQLLGQAYLAAYWFILHNRDATGRVADVLVERRVVFGDEVVALLDGLNLRIPDVDPLDEANWPRI